MILRTEFGGIKFQNFCTKFLPKKSFPWLIVLLITNLYHNLHHHYFFRAPWQESDWLNPISFVCISSSICAILNLYSSRSDSANLKETNFNGRRIYGGGCTTPLYDLFWLPTSFFKIWKRFFASVIKIISGIYG